VQAGQLQAGTCSSCPGSSSLKTRPPFLSTKNSTGPSAVSCIIFSTMICERAIERNDTTRNETTRNETRNETKRLVHSLTRLSRACIGKTIPEDRNGRGGERGNKRSRRTSSSSGSAAACSCFFTFARSVILSITPAGGTRGILSEFSCMKTKRWLTKTGSGQPSSLLTGKRTQQKDDVTAYIPCMSASNPARKRHIFF
jgi:hypothetical protein